MKYITLNKSNIENEHICCAFSDKKCVEGYDMKKAWLKEQFAKGLVFRRLDERAKVFIEYGPAEEAWQPIVAPNYLTIGCFWVSGQYKGSGHGKALLDSAIKDAEDQGKSGLVVVAGMPKFHFLGDPKWFIRLGFEVCDKTDDGFVLLAKRIIADAPMPKFADSVRDRKVESKGVVAYYSNRCPFTEYYVNTCLTESAEKRGLSLKIVKIASKEEAQSAPSPATIFSLFIDGKFITTDVSSCMDSRFDKIVSKKK